MTFEDAVAFVEDKCKEEQKYLSKFNEMKDIAGSKEYIHMAAGVRMWEKIVKALKNEAHKSYNDGWIVGYSAGYDDGLLDGIRKNGD